MYSCGVFPVWNYLDDFWTCGPPAPDPVCSSNLQTMLDACSDPGFTTNPSKTIGPCTCLELLGIVLNIVAQEARISESHLQEIIDLLLIWRSRKLCTKRQLQSLIGKLNFICFVCHPRRTFLRRLIDLLDSARHPSHHIYLTKRSLKDILLVVKILTISLERLQFLLQHCMMNSGLQVHVYICTPMPVTPHLAVCLIVCGFPRCSTMMAFLHSALLHLTNYLLSRLLWRYGPCFNNPARLFFIVTISLSFIFWHQPMSSYNVANSLSFLYLLRI